VRSLSGYVQTRAGRWLCFSILYNQVPGPVKAFEDLQDEAVHVLFDYRGN
jgi:D-alanyl-D-alanine carboxypeptidase